MLSEYTILVKRKRPHNEKNAVRCPFLLRLQVLGPWRGYITRLSPALLPATHRRCSGILRDDQRISSSLSRIRSWAPALTSGNLLAVSSILQQRCAAIMHQKKSACDVVLVSNTNQLALCQLLTDSMGTALGEPRVRISRIGGWPKRRLELAEFH